MDKCSNGFIGRFPLFFQSQKHRTMWIWKLQIDAISLVRIVIGNYKQGPSET